MLKAITQWMRRAAGGPTPIPEPLWRDTLAHYPFLARLPADEATRLRRLAEHFIDRKQFTGAHGLEVTDAMAVAVAAQACLPLLHWGKPAQALGWYGDFVTIVVHSGAVVARRRTTDEAGVVHHYDEHLVGEAMERGPVMLSWSDVDAAGQSAAHGTNVVVHEFAHKLDMQSGTADGCPPLPAGFMGTRTTRAAHALWWQAWQPAYDNFREQVLIAQRFGGMPPWLDSYGATAPAEFFAVACEAYFVNRNRFAQEFPVLLGLLDGFFRPGVGGD